jgi:hypothetical protein
MLTSGYKWWIGRVREIRKSPDPERVKTTIFEGIFNSPLPSEEKTDTRMASEAQLIVFAGEGTTGKARAVLSPSKPLNVYACE